ncbi:zinc finger protein 761-like isoform X2 [Mya arenaria]|uniref:zinc finger protein 761-like isoform X2 n=1 Tax=Mya arenaria TaxID=6604 RepID=UPI0022E2F1E1|nr:zinc finger protein 761-like isoform X2 [Mya arenaria]
MGSYLMMLYVTVDQELALKSYFTQQGWPFKKPDLKVTTEELGGVVQNCLQDPEEPQRPTPALQEKHPSNKRKAPQKQRLPAKVARQVLPTVDNNVPSNEVQDSVETSTAYEDIVAKVEKKDEVNEYHVATSKTVNNIVIEGEDFIVKEELPDSNDESDNDTIDNDFDIAEESGVDSKVEPPEDIPETRTLDEPGTCSEILVGASGQKESSIKINVISGSLNISGINLLEDTVSVGRFKCDLCDYCTNKLGNFKRHLNIHSEEMEMDPQTSTQTKPSSSTAATATKEYICDQCGNVYKTKYGFNLHKKRHEGTYKHTCQVCKRGFNQKTQLRFHCASHQGLPSSTCSFCNRTFKGHSSLQRHQRICSSNPQASVDVHSQFACNECSKTFSSKDFLNSHTKGKHGIPSYKCETCGKCFSWRSSLKVHKRSCK